MMIMLVMLGVFFLAVVALLYATKRESTSFADYAVGGRSFGAWFVAMCYTNSWWPGTVFISFAGLTVGAGVFGFYGLAYSLLGVVFMYFMATRAWKWGKKFNLMTQPDLLRERFSSNAVRLVASVIGVVAIFPWVVLGIQALGSVFEVASGNSWSVITCLGIGLVVIVIRQIWTVQMGMRGLILTDMLQGIVAYVVAAVVCVVLLTVQTSPAAWAHLAELPEKLLHIPGDGDNYGPFYLGSLIFTGIVGSLCWPMSFQRIYTAASVRVVKKATLATMLFSGGFYAILSLTMLATTVVPQIAAKPQEAWYTTLELAGGTWLLGLGVVIVFAASMGHIDGSVQVAGTQIANDIVAVFRPLSDKQLTRVAKGSMVIYMALAAVVAYLTFGLDRLQLLAQMSYQGIVQIAVPLFFGVFFKFGNKYGAVAGMVSGFVIAAVLTSIWPDDIKALGSITGGIIGLFVNVIVYLVVSALTHTSLEEKAHVEEMFVIASGTNVPQPQQQPTSVDADTDQVDDPRVLVPTI